jgi:hypothetical protein
MSLVELFMTKSLELEHIQSYLSLAVSWERVGSWE